MMSDQDKELLKKFGPDMMGAIDVDSSELLPQLKAKGALTGYQEQEILAQQVNHQMVRKLLYFLDRGRDDTLDLFISSLEASNHHHVAQLLLRATEMKKTLQVNLGIKLLEWAPSIEQLITIATQKKPVPYLRQKMKALTIDSNEDQQNQEVSLEQLLKQCKDEKRVIIIYGEAGAGKTTALKNIASCWIKQRMDVLQSFDYVFLIPLRLVQSHSLVDIICQDCRLLPKEFGQSLSRILDAGSKKVLFLLDSYEELSVCAKELNKLISYESRARASVLVTSRPGSPISLFYLAPIRTVQLEDFSEENVRDYVKHYSEGDHKMLCDLKKIFKMSFLQKPINLALACYMYLTSGTKGLNQVSQTKLFSKIVLHILTVYIHKNGCLKVQLSEIWDLFNTRNERLTGIKSTFVDICRLCFSKLGKQDQCLATDSIFDVTELMNFGLFCRDKQTNKVCLPHHLFKEFLAAVFLVVCPNAWKLQLVEIQEKCQNLSSNLADALRPMGLENVIRFAVGLSRDCGRDISKLFVIRQQTIGGDWYQSVYSFELQLIQECDDDSVRTAIAEGLLAASVLPVKEVSDYVHNRGAGQLLDIFADDQSHHFLAIAYDCISKSDWPGNLKLVRKNTSRPFIFDSFAVEYLKKYRYTSLEMGEKMTVQHSEIPVDLLPLLLSGVSDGLGIRHCTLYRREGQTVGRLDAVYNAWLMLPPRVKVELVSVKGVQLRDLGVTLPSVRSLDLLHCGDVDICGLSQTYTRLCELKVARDNRLVYGTDFTPMMAMKKLTLWWCGEVRLSQLTALCPQLTDLEIVDCQVSWADVRSQWLSLQRLKMKNCESKVIFCQLMRLCPSLEKLVIGYHVFGGRCEVFVDDIEHPWPTLRTLELCSVSYLVHRQKRLTEQEARQILESIVPSAKEITIKRYEASQVI